MYIKNAETSQNYEIISYDGKRVEVGGLEPGENQIDLTNYANGMYFLKIDTRTIKLNKQ